METDWQINLLNIKNRNKFLLETEKLADCRFLVGSMPNQRIFAVHRLILSMASPVFEVMFYGSLPEKDDPICIPDVQPDVFKAMLDYIYTDYIDLISFDETSELCYLGKKYMLPHVVERCTHFLWADLSPSNACRAYEFAKLFDEPRLMERSMELIVAKTLDVLADPSFMDIEVPTLMTILDQNSLNIDSEVDLFNCLLKLANQNGILNDVAKPPTDSNSKNASDVLVEEINKDPDLMHVVDDDAHNENSASNSGDASELTETCNSVPSVDDEVVVVNSDVSGNKNDVEVEEIIELSDSDEVASTLAGACGIVDNVADQLLMVDIDTFGDANDAEVEASTLAGACGIVDNVADQLLMVDIDAFGDANVVEVKEIIEVSNSDEAASTLAGACSIEDNAADEVVVIDIDASASGNASDINKDLTSATSAANIINVSDAKRTVMDEAILRQAVKKIRFLAMTSQQFAEGPARSKLLKQNEAYEILFKISSPAVNDCPMPEGFCQLGKRHRASSNNENRHCLRASNRFDSQYYNSDQTDSRISFKVDKNIYMWGIQIKFQLSPGQTINSGDFSVYLQDLEGLQFAFTSSIENVTDSQLDITFNSPVYIYHNKIYLIQVTFHKSCHYTMSTWDNDMVCNNVKFSFYAANLDESDGSGLINSIIFST